MKNRKNKLIAIFAALLLVALPACSQDKNPEETTSAIEQPTVGSGEVTTYADNVATKDPGEVTTAPEQVKHANERTFKEVNDKVKVIADAANLRKDTVVSKDSEYKQVTKDTVLTRTGYDSEWYRVKLDGDNGTYYISAKVVTLVVEEKVLETPKTVYITAGSLKARSSPDFEASNNIVGYLSKGTAVKVVAEGDGWYRIEYKNKANEYSDYAYIGTKYTSETKPDGTETGKTEGTTEAVTEKKSV